MTAERNSFHRCSGSPTICSDTNAIWEISANASDIIEEIRTSWDEEDDPTELFSILKTTLQYFEENGAEDEQLQVADLLLEIDHAISVMNTEQSESPTFNELDAVETPTSTEAQQMSIFDDVDE